MKSALIVVAVVGCGGTPKPAPVVAAPKPAPPPAEKVVVNDCTTAATALVKEHGYGKIAADKQATARIAGEAEVIAACLDDQWSSDMITCATTRAAPSSCIGQLSEYQEQSFRAHLADWETNWTKKVAKKGEDDPPPPPPEDDATPGDLPKPKDPDHEEWISCRESLGDIASYEPKIGASVADRDYAVLVRESALRRSCESRWTNPTKKCLGAARDAAAVATCRAGLDAAGKNTIANALTDADAKYAEVEAIKKTARAIDCKAITAAHYPDDAIRNRLTSIDPVERKRVFSESKAVMTATCTKDKWSASVRACIAVARSHDNEIEECFPRTEFRAGRMFGIPAVGVYVKTGIAACDALADTVKKVAACDKVEPHMRQMMLESYGMQLGLWIDYAVRSPGEISRQCKENQAYFEQSARDHGCTL